MIKKHFTLRPSKSIIPVTPVVSEVDSFCKSGGCHDNTVAKAAGNHAVRLKIQTYFMDR